MLGGTTILHYVGETLENPPPPSLLGAVNDSVIARSTLQSLLPPSKLGGERQTLGFPPSCLISAPPSELGGGESAAAASAVMFHPRSGGQGRQRLPEVNGAEGQHWRHTEHFVLESFGVGQLRLSSFSNAHEISSPFASRPLTPSLSPEYRGEGVIS